MLGRRLLGKPLGPPARKGWEALQSFTGITPPPGSLKNSLQVRLRHSLCSGSKSNNFYALTQHTRDILLPQKRGFGLQLRRERSQAICTGSQQPPALCSGSSWSILRHSLHFVFNFVQYTIPGNECQWILRKKLYCFIRMHIKIEKEVDFTGEKCIACRKIVTSLDKTSRVQYNEQCSEKA